MRNKNETKRYKTPVDSNFSSQMVQTHITPIRKFLGLRKRADCTALFVTAGISKGNLWRNYRLLIQALI